MKKICSSLTLIGIIIINFNSYAQNNSTFGFYQPDRSVPCISPTQHLTIEKEIKKSQDELINKGFLRPTNPNQVMTTLFAWPVEQTNGLNDYGVHGISNFVDQNMLYPNQVLDFNCGNRTYDTPAGYNHGGTDIFTWPFPWYKMDSSQVKIVAAAPGTITYKSDGNFDRSCASNSNMWNAVYITHADGSVAWYGHMKNGSLTVKSVGQTVVAGEYLGVVGSSGNSTGPHLHFEIHDAGGVLIDPYAGSCNSLNTNSWWIVQRPYYDSSINALRTNSTPPVSSGCPQTETLNEKNQFCLSQNIYFLSYYRDQQVGQVSQFRVFRPDNTLWTQWSTTNSTYYPASWWSSSNTIPVNAITGIWKFQVIYNGQTYERLFDVNGITTISASGNTNFCAGDSVILQAPVSQYGFNYQWKINGTDINGATSSSYKVSASGTYSCVVTTINGCSTTSNSIGVTVSTPTATITPNGATTFCQGGSVILTANSGNSYLWSNGATSQSITVSATGNYSVIVTNASGCSATSAITPVTVNPLPSATITPQGATTFCSGDSVILAANTGTGLTYQWKKGANLISGAASNNYTATGGGTYKVIVTNSSGCSKTSGGAIVTVNPRPTATITSANSTNFCTGGSDTLKANTGSGLTYQWQKENINISGETASKYTAITTGTFNVIITSPNGCSKTSNSISVLDETYCEYCIQWQNAIGGNGYDELKSLQQTTDGGYILGGFSSSSVSGDKTENNLGGYDYWIVKMDALGNIQWQNTIGGNSLDFFNSIQQTTDGGFILAGTSNSNISGDKTENSIGNTNDYWVVKLDATGNIQWQKTIGGTGDDGLNSIEQTSEGGYILGGYSRSNISGNKTENNLGESDYWVVKLDAAGTIQWQNTIGGNGNDVLAAAEQTTDGGYILGGYSDSNISGDKAENSLGYIDYWVIKLDTAGNIQWQNTIGGGISDQLYTICQTTDEGYIMGGHSYSNISGDKTENRMGGDDYWVVKINSLGNIQWQNTIGGNNGDYLRSIEQTIDGGFILGGYSDSNISGDKTENKLGYQDYWIVKLDASGNIKWQNTIGGNDTDVLNSIKQTTNGGFIVGGYSESTISGDKTEDTFGYWVIKLGANVCPVPSTGFQTTNITSSSAKVKWTIRNCAISYTVQYRINGTTSWTTKTVSTNTGLKNLTGLLASTTYQWRVKSKCDVNSYSTYSPTQIFTTTAMRLSDNIEETLSDFKITPNPTSGNFIFEFNSGANQNNGAIEIFNSLGQSIFLNSLSISEGENQKEIDLSKFPSGIYFLNLKTEKETYRQKIIKE